MPTNYRTKFLVGIMFAYATYCQLFYGYLHPCRHVKFAAKNHMVAHSHVLMWTM